MQEKKGILKRFSSVNSNIGIAQKQYLGFSKSLQLTRWLFLNMGIICCFSGAYADNKSTISVLQLLEEPNEQAFMYAPAIRFYQSSGSGTEIQKVALAYYGSTDCTGTSLGAYTTPDGSTAFPISGTNPFSLNSTSVWKVAKNKIVPSIANPQTSVRSIQVNFRSRNGDTKANFNTTSAQCNFYGNCCVPVTCSDGDETCTNNSLPDQPFVFTPPQIGDAYRGGVVYRINAGRTYILSLADLINTVTWGPTSGTGSNVSTNANNTFNTSTDNTYVVLNVTTAPNRYPAALACRNYTVGSEPGPWFLPARSEWPLVVGTGTPATDNSKLPILNAKSIISGFTQFTSSQYWSSTQAGTSTVYIRYFTGSDSSGENSFVTKTSSLRVRCVRSL